MSPRRTIAVARKELVHIRRDSRSLAMALAIPLLLLLLGRIRPTIHFRNMVEPLVMAFSTSSSGATLPAMSVRPRAK